MLYNTLITAISAHQLLTLIGCLIRIMMTVSIEQEQQEMDHHIMIKFDHHFILDQTLDKSSVKFKAEKTKIFLRFKISIIIFRREA